MQVGNPGPFIFFNAFKCFVNVKMLTLEKYMKHLHLLNVSIHRNFYQNWFINESARKKSKNTVVSWFKSFTVSEFLCEM